MALVGRALTAYEKRRPILEQKLHLVRWALHRCRRFTAVTPRATIHLPDPAHVLVMEDKLQHLRIEALRVDLDSYRATYAQAEVEGQLWVEAIAGGCADDGGGEEDVELPVFVHSDRTLRYPATQSALPSAVANAPHWCAFFDGGAARGVGTGGGVVFAPGGRCAGC